MYSNCLVQPNCVFLVYRKIVRSHVSCCNKAFHLTERVRSYSSSFLFIPEESHLTMVIVSCPAAPCDYKTEDVSETLASKLLDLHVGIKHSRLPSAPMKGPKLARPTVDMGENEESWNAFKRRWETFKRGSRISEDESAVQLFECASLELSTMLLKLDQAVTTLPEHEVMEKCVHLL